MHFLQIGNGRENRGITGRQMITQGTASAVPFFSLFPHNACPVLWLKARTCHRDVCHTQHLHRAFDGSREATMAAPYC